MPPSTVEHPYIRINGNSGYSRHGDTLSLFVDRIDNLNEAGITSGDLAVQLWACHTGYGGGPLSGWKLAEHPLGTLQANHYLAPIRADLQADFPESGDYAVALVIAEWDGAGYNRVHDYHNYPRRDLFLHPGLAGPVAYRFVDAGRIVVEVGRIHNPRDPNNISGTLCLELWALPAPYAGGAFAGHALAAVTLGSLAGAESWQDCVYDLQITVPPAGTYALVLMVREWVGSGYVTRDHYNLDQVTFPLVTPMLQANTTAIADVSPGQGASEVQSQEPLSEAAGVGGAEREQAHPAPADKNMFARFELDELKRFVTRLFEWLKKNFVL